jgi:predicted nucleotidyltransferase
MDKNTILAKLSRIKPQYEKEGFIIEGIFGSAARPDTTSPGDIDILVHTTPQFAKKHRFEAISRYNEIREEIGNYLQYPVDIASSTGMGTTAKRYIIDRALYL